jgi:hypothetical protein
VCSTSQSAIFGVLGVDAPTDIRGTMAKRPSSCIGCRARRLAKGGFGLLEKNRLRWFDQEGALLGSILSKDPIRRVYWAGDAVVMENPPAQGRHQRGAGMVDLRPGTPLADLPGEQLPPVAQAKVTGLKRRDFPGEQRDWTVPRNYSRQ